MACSLLPNTTITASLQWWQVSGTLAKNISCAESYARPAVGGALMPWVFTATQIIIHVPVMALRVARWEDAQTLSIILAVFNVALACQAYQSTHLSAEDVLVWSPSLMALVIDEGAMLQLIVLVLEVHPNWWAELWRKRNLQDENGRVPWETHISYF